MSLYGNGSISFKKPTAENILNFTGQFYQSMYYIGKITFANGDIFDGKFFQRTEENNFQLVANGKKIFANGDIYVGDIRNDKLNSFGVFKYNTSSFITSYIGHLSPDGIPHGNGIATYKNKFKYEGNFRAGKKHGTGKYIHENGNMYEGEFCDDSYFDMAILYLSYARYAGYVIISDPT